MVMYRNETAGWEGEGERVKTIKEIAASMGMTITDFARKAGIQESRLYKLSACQGEDNGTVMTAIELLKIALVAGMNPMDVETAPPSCFFGTSSDAASQKGEKDEC